MVYKMDTAGEVSVSELLAFEVLLLEIAIDNGASKAVAEAHQEARQQSQTRRFKSLYR